MAQEGSVQITGSPDSFKLTSTWRVANASSTVAVITEGPSTATQSVSFTVALPADATITNAYVHSEWGSPNTGYATRSVNGTAVKAENNSNVSVPVDVLNGTVSYEFKFKANGSTSGGIGYHSGVASVSNVYLYIDYTYSDPVGVIYRAESGTLVGYAIYRAENNSLVPYQLYRAESGTLVKY